MDNQSKSKSLILQEVVSENPEKILSRKKCEMGEEVASFLGEILNKRSDVKDFIFMLGVRRNKKIFVSLREK